MRRPGRKRKSGPRHPGGQVVRAKRVDATPEQKQRRKYLAQGGDESKTGYPLGVLLVNNAIDQHQHRAGCRYAWLYQMVFGRVSITAANYDGAPRGGGREMPEGVMGRMEREIEDMIATLEKCGAKKIVDEVALYGRTPRWFLGLPKIADVRDGERLVAGLSALCDVTEGRGPVQG